MAVITNTAGKGNMGRDITVALITADGTVLATEQIISVEYRQITMDITRTLCNAHTILADLPRYWEGTIEMIRGDNQVDASVSALEQLWLNTQQADYTLGTLQFDITTAAGSSSMTFLDCTIKQDQTNWKAEDLTTMRLTFRAGRRVA